MTLFLTRQVDATKVDVGGNQVRLLDFSLPIPEDSSQRIRALSYLNETVEHYISEFCDPRNTEDRHLGADLAAEAAAIRKANHEGLSLPRAAQVFLCFSICLFI